MGNYRQEYEKWLASGVLTPEETAELEAIRDDDREIESRFYANLVFGTAGLRGTMGMGTNRMNVYVIRHATQAFAEVVLAEGPEAAKRGVAICFDCRNHSEEFAQTAACVMAANGIPSYLFSELRPTPELSFAVREYGCIAGINVTASHNPKEYNGYKVYWEDGAQLPPVHASAIAAKMDVLDVFKDVKCLSWEDARATGLITMLGEDTDNRFLANVFAQRVDVEAVREAGKTIKMVFTPFHGTGWKLIPYVLRQIGIEHVYCVPEQMVIDGDFPTVASPNPENAPSFAMAVELAKQVGADFILGSDPDADRVGVMIRSREGDFVPVSGNQTGVLLLDYLIGALRRAGKMPEKPVALKTIVTTEMARAVANQAGLDCYDTFTGFKFLAEKKNKLEATGEGKVIFAYEESYGYMVGDYVRDKDAVTAALLLTSMAAWYYGQNKTLWDALDEIRARVGWYGEKTLNLMMPGLDGLDKMKNLMARLRSDPPADLAGTPVMAVRDYLAGTRTSGGKAEPMELKDSNVLGFELADGTLVQVRPSGTEPKIKIYVLAKGENGPDVDAKVAAYAAWAEALA